MDAVNMPESVDASQVVKQAPVGIEPNGARLFTKPLPATLLLTPEELMVVADSQVVMRQGRHDLAMIRRPTPRGGERVELAALDGQQAILRFTRTEAGSAGMLAAWLAGLPLTG